VISVLHFFVRMSVGTPSSPIPSDKSNRFSLSLMLGPLTDPAGTYWQSIPAPLLSPSSLRLTFLEFSCCGLSAKPSDVDPVFLVAVVLVPDNGSGLPAFTPVIFIGGKDGVTFYAPPSDLVTVLFVSPVDGHQMVSHPVDLPPMTRVFIGAHVFVSEPLNEFYVTLVMNGNVSYR
jgi:hypothetical protein